MVYDIIRDSSFGQLVNWASNGKYMPYADQRPNYKFPMSSTLVSQTSTRVPSAAPSIKDGGKADVEKAEQEAPFGESPVPVDEIPENAYLVDWDGPNDPDNPRCVHYIHCGNSGADTHTEIHRNWSFFKKCWVVLDISLLTFSVYIGSAIYTSAIPSLMHDFGVAQVVGTLGLSLYVFAYGIGPLVRDLNIRLTKVAHLS